MKKLYRSALVAGVLALGVAACGDDVTIVEPEPTPPPPLSVTMTPSNQTVNVGEDAVFAVGVSGGAEGAQASWTCSSSATGVATVAPTDSGCRATAVAAGNASITVTVTKGNQSANAGAQVIVTSVTVAPATITIASIQQGGTPVNIENISGQVDVTLNVNPRDETVQRVILFVDGVEVASQVFTAAMADGGDAVAEALQQITLSFRTDFYSINETAGTATPRHMNGDRVISAALEVVGTDANRPSNTVPVRFNNTSGFHVTTDVTSKPSAIDANGLLWYGGPDFGTTTVTAYPVLYDGGTVNSVSMNMCGQSTTDTTAPFAFTRACSLESTNVVPSFTSLVSNEPGPAAILNGTARFGLSAHPFPVRIDRVGPTGAAIRIAQVGTVGNRENWVRADYPFTTGYTAPSDGGVGLPSAAADVRTFNVRQGTTVIATDVTSPAALDESPTNTAYNVQVVVRDRLGNTTTVNQATGTAPNALATFGVDKTAPQLTWLGDDDLPGAIEADTITMDAHGGLYGVRATDLISGFAAPGLALTRNALEHNLIQVTGNYLASPTALARTAIVGTGTPSSTPFAAAAAGNFIAGPVQVSTFDVALSQTAIEFDVDLATVAAAGPGYFIYQVRARDKAGNVTSVAARSAYVNAGETPAFDQSLQTPIAVPYPAGSVVPFQAVADDAVELVASTFAVEYGIFTLWGDINPVPNDGVKFNDVIVRPQFLDFEASLGIRSLSPIFDGLTVTSNENASGVIARVYSGFADLDVMPWAAGPGTAVDVAAMPAIVPVSATFWNSLQAQLVDTGFTITVENWNATTQTSTGIVQIKGTPSVFNDPFAAVAIVENGGAANVRVVGLATRTTAGAFPHLDDGAKREFRWTFTVSGVDAGSTLHAVGLVGNDGLVTGGANADGS